MIFSRAKSSASPACWAPDAMCWSTYSTAYARRNAAPSTSRAGRGAFVRQKQAIRAGMALVPRDRRHQGLILPFTTADNINLASLPETATFGWERRGIAEQKARDWIEQLAIRPGRPGLPVRYMSGGNQQKSDPCPLAGGPMPGCLFSMNPPWGSISAPAGIFINVRASWPIKDGRCWSPPATPPNCSDYATGSWSSGAARWRPIYPPAG